MMSQNICLAHSHTQMVFYIHSLHGACTVITAWTMIAWVFDRFQKSFIKTFQELDYIHYTDFALAKATGDVINIGLLTFKNTLTLL